MGALSFWKRPLISGQKCCIIAQVFNVILLATDSVDSVILMLLGAFVAVDHNILISRIKHCGGRRHTFSVVQVILVRKKVLWSVLDA